MKAEDDQPLWDLLGKSAAPRVSPFFARNILRQIRGPHPAWRFSGWLMPKRWLPLSGAAVTAAIAVLLMMHTPAPTRKPAPTPVIIADVDDQDADLAADLDDLTGPDDGLASDVSVL